MNLKERAYQFLERPETNVRGNLTKQVTAALRHAIVSLKMKPGEDIDKIAICDRLKVSRFPVSEALARLQTEGLVDILPQRGTRVSLLKISTVREFMLIRRAVEAEITRTFALSPDANAINRMQALLAEQSEAVAAQNSERYHQLDYDFHSEMLTPLRLPHVDTIILNARSNLQRTNRLLDSHHRFTHTLDEHQIILDAVGLGNPDAAADAMRAHMDAVMDSVMRLATQKPHLFADGDIELAN